MNLIEVALGLALVYLLLSTLCSGINEWLAQRYSRRGAFLREGLAHVVTDRWVLLRLINHPSIKSLYRERPGMKVHPSYLPAELFATALLDLLVQRARMLNPGFQPAQPFNVGDLRQAVAICAAAGFSVARALVPLVQEADAPLAPAPQAGATALERAKKNVEGWYESAMERVSGWYKRSARVWMFWLGFVVAVILNVDSIGLANALFKSDSLRTSVADRAEAYLKTVQAAKELAPPKPGETPKEGSTVTSDELRQRAAVILGLRDQGLPIGYTCLSPAAVADSTQSLVTIARSCWNALPANPTLGLKLIGWLITAMAVSLGAPFWFDLINRFVDMRGAGRKPAPATT